MEYARRRGECVCRGTFEGGLRQLNSTLNDLVEKLEFEEDEEAEPELDLSFDPTEGGVPDSLTLFMNELGRYPLLTAADEVELAKRIERGDREAKERMINSNLRLVVHNARRYMGHGVSLGDLIQEGIIGLNRAVEKFDWRGASSSRRTRPGGSARPASARSRTSRRRSGSPSTSTSGAPSSPGPGSASRSSTAARRRSRSWQRRPASHSSRPRRRWRQSRHRFP